MKEIFFITGASGVGKTSLLDELKKKLSHEECEFLHFDSIGVPSVEDMVKEYGSPSAWQKKMTLKWVHDLVNNHDAERIFFEGQVNLKFIQDAFKHYGFTDYQVVLIDCSEEEMASRLIHQRGQPELLNDDMKNWLKFLRKQAVELSVPVIDTTNLSRPEILTEFERIIQFA